jgi:hypothetical protein
VKYHQCEANENFWTIYQLENWNDAWVIGIEGATDSVIIIYCPFCGVKL